VSGISTVIVVEFLIPSTKFLPVMHFGRRMNWLGVESKRLKVKITAEQMC